uniref:Uncharacterized protein n=1 Tax=Mola mola TaxID=94237 RepID=A0A3Q3WL40_MOLML
MRIISCSLLQMEASPQQGRVGGGLWTTHRAAQYSKETQDLLRCEMTKKNVQLSHFFSLSSTDGSALPLTFDSTSSASPHQPKTNRKCLSDKPQRRTAESCRSGNSYVREKFCPGPSRDLEKEKRRLQNIMSTGQEEPTAVTPRNVPACRSREVEEERDRYQEVLDEIEERRQFLADMDSLGQVKQYVNLINTEISQVNRDEADARRSEEKTQSRTVNRWKAPRRSW